MLIRNTGFVESKNSFMYFLFTEILGSIKVGSEFRAIINNINIA